MSIFSKSSQVIMFKFCTFLQQKTSCKRFYMAVSQGMKIAILSTLLVCYAVASHAQEGVTPPELTESTTDRYVSPEDRSFNKADLTIKEIPVSKDLNSTSKSNSGEKSQKQGALSETKSVKAKTEKAPARELAHEEDDVLSFNFLYYLFQRFKSTDLTDQK
jgi:hypothetical protein